MVICSGLVGSMTCPTKSECPRKAQVNGSLLTFPGGD